MSDRIDGYATALFEVARAEGALDEVEDELFRFGRVLAANADLQNTLTDQRIPPERRQAIVEDLLGGRAHPVTVAVVSFVVAAGRARDLPAIIERLVDRASSSKDVVLAEVRAAVALTDDQKARLAAALANATNQRVEVKVVVDPAILGGLLAQVGDLVIDGSVRGRLDQLKTFL